MRFFAASLNSFEFEDLRQLIADQGVEIEEHRSAPTHGEKSVGDLVTFEVTTVSIAAVGLVIQAVKFWLTQKYNCSVTLTAGESTVELNGLTLEEAKSWYLEHSSNDGLPCEVAVRSGE